MNSDSRNLKTILLIDDDEDIRRILIRHARSAHYQICVAETLEAAWRMTTHSAPDLILLDWNMPDGTGADFLIRLDREHRSIPVILLTARINISSEVDAAFSFISDYVAKPFTVEELLLRVERILHAESSRHRLRDLEARLGGSTALDRLGKDLLREQKESAANFHGIEFDSPDGWAAAGLIEEAFCVGGDILEEFEFSGGAKGYVVADVCGKGLAVAAISSLLRGAIVGHAAKSGGPAELLTCLNMFWRASAPRRYLATVLVVSITRDHPLRWASAGHPSPYVRQRGAWSLCDVESPMLGLFASPSFKEKELYLGADDRFCAFSDGAFEISTLAGDRLDEEGFHRVLEAHLDGASLRVAVSRIHATIRGVHEGRPADDDLALLIIGKQKNREERIAA